MTDLGKGSVLNAGDLDTDRLGCGDRPVRLSPMAGASGRLFEDVGADNVRVGRSPHHGGRDGSSPISALQKPALEKSEWTVSSATMRQLREMIGRDHYAGRGSITAVFRFGLYRKTDLWCAGVSWWIPPTKHAAAASYDGDFRRVLALHRLACHPDAPKNAASFLIRHSVTLIRRDGRFDCLVSYADVGQGHTGAIYKASGWEYLGLIDGDTTWLDPCGVTISRQTGGRGRTQAAMLSAGCRPAGKYQRHKFRILFERRAAEVAA